MVPGTMHAVEQGAIVRSVDSFSSRGTLSVQGADYEIYRLSAVPGTDRLPFSLKVLAENLLRTEDGATITADHIRTLAEWDPKAAPSHEIQFTPGRVVMRSEERRAGKASRTPLITQQ